MQKKFLKNISLISLFVIPLAACGGTKESLNLKDFVICYDDTNKYHEEYFANDLQRHLKENGVELTVKKSTEVSKNSKRIIIGNQPTDIQTEFGYKIYKEGQSIILNSLSSSGYADGLKVLSDSLDDCIQNNSELNGIFDKPLSGTGINQTVKVMSFNLRCGDDAGGNFIDDRLPRQVAFIRNELPDTFGCQEAIFKMTDYLCDNLSDTYDYVGETYAPDSEMCPIFYNKNTVEVLDSGTRWYSSTPDIPGSRLPVSSNYTRIYTFGLFKDIATENVFLHINTHMDLDMGEPYGKADARLLEAQILADFADKYYNIPRFLTADYNCTEVDGDAISYLEKERGYVRSSQLSTLRTSTELTFPWAYYSSSYVPGSQKNIDFILCKGDNVLVDTYDVHTSEVTPLNGGTKGKLSDHYQISSDVLLYTPLGGKEEFNLADYETYRYKTQLNGVYNSPYKNAYTYRAIDGLTSGVRSEAANGREKGAVESISKLGSFQTYRFTSEEDTVADIEYVLSSINYYSNGNHETSHLGSCVTIEINGKKANIDSYKLPVNGASDWYNWQKIYIKDVNIKKGSNFIKLTNTSGTAPNLSHIVVHTDGYLYTDKPIIEGENFNLKVINNKMYAELYIPSKDYEPDEYHLSLDIDYDFVTSEIKERIETGVRLLVDLTDFYAGTTYYPHVRINDYLFDNNKGDLVGRTTHSQGEVKDKQTFNGRTYSIIWNWNMPTVSITDNPESVLKEENTHLEENIKERFGYFDESDFKNCSCVTPGNNIFLMGDKAKNINRFKSAHLTEVGLPILYIRNNQASNTLKLVIMDTSTNKITQIVPLTLSASESSKYTEAGPTVAGGTTFKVNKWLTFSLNLTLGSSEIVGIAVTSSDSLFFGYRNSDWRTTVKDISPFGLTSFDQSSSGISVGSTLGSYSTGNQEKIMITYDFVGDFYFSHSEYRSRELQRNINTNRQERYKPLKNILNGKKLSVFGDSISSNVDFSNRVDVNTTMKGNYVAYDNKSSGIFSAKNMWWHMLSDDIGTDILVANGFSGDALSSKSTVTECRGLDRCVQLHNNTQSPNILPDIIAVYFGVNDFIYKNIPTGTFSMLYESMIQKMTARYPDATIFYSTFAPAANADFKNRNLEEYLVYCEIVRTLVQKYQDLGYKVGLVDMRKDSGITESNLGLYSHDLLHPNCDGMRKFADCFLESMYKYFIH